MRFPASSMCPRRVGLTATTWRSDGNSKKKNFKKKKLRDSGGGSQVKCERTKKTTKGEGRGGVKAGEEEAKG